MMVITQCVKNGSQDSYEMYKHVSLINISNKELSFKVIYLSFLKQ